MFEGLSQRLADLRPFGGLLIRLVAARYYNIHVALGEPLPMQLSRLDSHTPASYEEGSGFCFRVILAHVNQQLVN